MTVALEDVYCLHDFLLLFIDIDRNRANFQPLQSCTTVHVKLHIFMFYVKQIDNAKPQI